MRRLNDIGVFTVFVVLDSLSKVFSALMRLGNLSIIDYSVSQDSVVDIKVPTFVLGKVMVIGHMHDCAGASYVCLCMNR